MGIINNVRSTAVFLLVLLPVLAGAQTARELETLLETKAVSYAQAARFVLEASEAAVIADQEAAFRFAADKKWLPAKIEAGGRARLSALSLLLMRSFDIKGGLFYSIFKNPHYAYRELLYREVILGRTDPEMEVSGDDLLYMVNQLLSRKEETPGASAKRLAAEEQARQRAALAEKINTQLTAMSVVNTTAQATKEGVSITLSNIQFLADSAVLADQEKKKLDEIARILKTIPGKIQVAGHTTHAGTEAGRLRISLERAQAVAAYLSASGVRRAEDIAVRGYGSRRPLTSNNTAEDMTLNRRVEITILEE